MEIVIIDHEPYSQRRAKHFFIEKFRSQGIFVEFWSIWKVLSYNKYTRYTYQEVGESVHYLNTKAGLVNRLKGLNKQNTFIFAEFWINPSSLFVFEAFHKLKLKWGRLEYYYNPAVNFRQDIIGVKEKIPFLDKLKSLSKDLITGENLKYRIISKFRKKYYESILTAHISFVTGKNRENLNRSNEIISIDYFDIEDVHLEKQKSALLNYPYIVFADIYLGKHPDLQVKSRKPYMDTNIYYQRLNTFFTLLEEKLKMPVVIAAHPKANYSNEFGDRLCIQNQTANLIINSKLLIQHFSLSTTFALLSEKKIIHFYDNDFLVNPVLLPLYKVMLHVSNRIGSDCINIDDIPDIEVLADREPNVCLYNRALELFFTKDQDDKRSNFEIIRDNIFKLMKPVL